MAKSELQPVAAYLARQPPEVRAALTRVRGIILKAVPGLEEGISYQIPVYKLGGELVIYAAGWKAHYSLYPATDVAQAFAKELAPYEVSKGTIRFRLDEPVPVKLIERIVKFRAKLAQERAALKAERVKAKRKTATKRATSQPAKAAAKSLPRAARKKAKS
jgi:uncharacterized protein YdhG (YjbR/CyaY superfamily)